MQSVNFNFMTRRAAYRRGGTTLLELIAAGAVLGILLIVCAQMLGRAAVQQQAIGHRRAALQTASNAMERAHALSWDDVDAARMETIVQAVVEQGVLRGSRLAIAVDQPESTPPSKRIRVTVIWTEGGDAVQRKQELTAWRYAPLPHSTADADPAAPSPVPEEER